MPLNQANLRRARAEERLRDRLAEISGRQPACPDVEVVPSPLSPAQERLWILQQLDPGSPIAHRPLALRLVGPLDRATLRRCLDDIVQRHTVLRTVYREDAGGVTQHLLPPARVPFDFDDLREHTDAETQSRLVAEAHRPFDLRSGPIVRAVLQQRADNVHVLLLVFHHIAFDGWSAEILCGELATLYRAHRRDEPANLSPLPIQYAEFARWQHEQARDGAFDGQLAWWRRQLADLPALELTTDFRRPDAPLIKGARHAVALPVSSLIRATQLARDEQTTLFTVLLTAVQAWLFRHTGQTDFGVSVPAAGRTHPDAEPLIGCFINLLVLRADLSGDPSFRVLLHRTRQTALTAQAHQDVPFAEVVEALHPQRHINRMPLAQALFQLRNIPKAPVTQVDGLQIGPFAFDSGIVGGQDLALELEETKDGLHGGLSYSTDLFAPATVACLIEHFRRLLDAALDAPDVPISELPMMGETERRRLLVDFNDTARDFPADVCLHELFEAQAERTPDAVALVFEEKELTYAALEQRANRLAHVLEDRGVGPEVLVGLYLERSFEMVAGLLAVLKAGGAWVPLDPALPEARLRFLLEDAQPALILTQRHLAALLPAAAVPLCFADDPHDAAATTRVASAVGADNLAYVLYTSGSTGTPKGVLIEHRAICNHALWVHRKWPLEPDDVVLMHTPLHFDISLAELFSALLAGARLILPRPDRKRDPAQLVWLIERHRVTSAHAVPTLWRAMLNEPAFRRNRSLKRVITGGEVLSVELAERLMETTSAELHNWYGPTETAIDATAWHCRRDDGRRRSVPIGQPLDNVRVYVLNQNGEPAPQGIAGELYIGGVQVARGYLNRPQLTAERFLPDPFSDAPGARLYRTGDMVRWRSDGALEFIGRIDHQVKLRGHRIELGEIEAVLLQHAAVRACVVTMWEAAPGDQRLVAYVVGEADAARLRTHLKTYLPEHMVPSHFEALDALPLLPNGKIDRHALPLPSSLSDERHGFEPPETPTEHALAGIWSALLRVRQVGRRDDFFELGGHSLLATQVIWRLRERFAVDVPLASFFENATLAGLAGVIEQARDVTQPAPRHEVVPRRSGDGPAVLSSAQQRLWFIDQLEVGSSLYNIPAALRLRGPLDEDALRLALDALLERHTVLRTTFQATSEGPLQSVEPPRPLPVEVLDVRDRPAEKREAEGLALLTEAARQPFDLTTDLMLRARLVRLADEEHLLGLTLHHIAADGWSIDLLWRELSELYAAFTERRTPALAPLPIQYADYAVWQRERLAGAEMAAQLDYWKRQLAGVAPLELPTDRPRPPVQSHRGASCEHILSAQLTAGLERLARRERTTLFMVLLAGYKTLLHRYTGQQDSSVGSPIAGRNRSELEPLIGFFVNSLVLRTELSGELSFKALLGRVRDVALAAYDHQNVPFDQIVEVLNPPRDRSRTPLFQTMFALQNQPRHAQQWKDIAAQRLFLESGTAKFDLVTHALPDGHSLRIRFNYATDLFDRATIERLAGHFETLLEGIVEAPDTPLWQLPMLREIKRTALAGGNAVRQSLPDERRVHRLFERQARQTPDAPAVTDDSVSWTYTELDRRADRLARALRTAIGEHGAEVSGEPRIGLCVARTAQMVVAMLGTLKAGGAYVPLDPGSPDARLRLMIEDTGMTAIVADPEHRHRAETLGTLVLTLGDNDLADDSDVVLPAPHDTDCSGESPAYVMYTSGSTGQPKGVVVPHRAVIHLVCSTDYVALGADDVIAQAAHNAFDATTFEVWGALLNGARLVVLPRDVLLSPPQLARALRAHGVTTLFLTTALFNLVAQQTPDAFASLRTLLFGGQRVEPRWVRAVLASDPPERLLHVYGPTETTTFASWHEVEDVADDATNLPIGKPLAGTTLWVLDGCGRMQPAPVGVAGELYVGGLGVALGYQDRPSLTEERFVPDPFTGNAAARLYRTGDRVRRLPGGEIEFLGRWDRQLKLRGFRIEPGEVEAALGSHPAVRDAVVRLTGENDGPARLIAYAAVGEPAAGNGVTEAALRKHLLRLLPDYMVPSAVVVMKELPLTANGKIDHRRLPAPDTDNASAAAPVAPRDALETLLHQLWVELLKRQPIGVTDDFFALGGHSLMAARLFSRLETQTGFRLPLALLFDAPTIATLAAAIRRRDWQASWSSLVQLEPRPRPDAPAFFCVHDAGGNVLNQRNLARRLGDDCAYFGLQAVGLDGVHPPLRWVEEMANLYLRDVRRVQPRGPYFFGGFSFGGVVAYEMARQMQQAGEEVALLVLLDCGVPPRILSLPDRLRYRALSLLKRHGGRLLSRPEVRSRLRQVRRLHTEGRLDDPSSAAARTFWKIHRRMMQACKVALRTYDPGPYRGPAVLVRMSRKPRHFPALHAALKSLLRWEMVIPDLEVLELEGRHLMLIEEPVVGDLAAFLRPRLAAGRNDRMDAGI